MLERLKGLGREITIVLVIKTALLFVLWWLFFSPEHKVPVDPEVLKQVLIGSGDEPLPGEAE